MADAEVVKSRSGCDRLLHGVALIRLAKLNKTSILPELYFKAAGEMLAILFAFSWITTLVARPDVIASNPLKDRLGYNNFCVGFDSTPATYIAQVLFCPCVYLVLQFSKFDMERTALLARHDSSKRVWFPYITDAMYAASICVFSLVFVISPFESVWGHSLPFIQYIVFRYLVVVANVWEYDGTLALKTKIFVVVYGLVSLLYPLALITNYVTYEPGQEGPLLWWQLVMVLDYSWFLCLALTTAMIPDSGKLFYSIAINVESDEGDRDHLFEIDHDGREEEVSEQVRLT